MKISHRKIIRKPQATPSMRAFDMGIEPGEIIEDERLLSVNGWLNPFGVLIGCAWQNHKITLRKFNLKTEKEAESVGYIKLSEMHWHIETRYEPVNPTIEQLKTIYRWHELNQIHLSYFERQRMVHNK